MQTPIKEEENVHDLHKYRQKRKQARYYWNMTKCGYTELSRHAGVTLRIARMWEITFLKEHQRRLRE